LVPSITMSLNAHSSLTAFTFGGSVLIGDHPTTLDLGATKEVRTRDGLERNRVRVPLRDELLNALPRDIQDLSGSLHGD
jgi:hypothetical protein